MIPCYELITFNLGKEIVQARPVGWDREIYDGFGNDKNGVLVTAIKFHATCPFCGNLIEFGDDDFYVSVDKSKKNIKCPSCKAGKEPKPKKKKKDPAPTVHVTTFIDPLDSFDYIDKERLKKIDLVINQMV